MASRRSRAPIRMRRICARRFRLSPGEFTRSHRSRSSSSGAGSMFEVEMLPAREGDSLWLRYGSKTAPKQILVDAGRAATYKDLRERFLALPKGRRTFELFVITHVDRDH